MAAIKQKLILALNPFILQR